MTKIIKGFLSTFVGVVIGGEAIKQTGANLSGGIGKATQTFIGLGILANAAKNTKFKFK